MKINITPELIIATLVLLGAVLAGVLPLTAGYRMCFAVSAVFIGWSWYQTIKEGDNE